MKKIILISLFVFGFWVRLWKIDAPIADWHSWRQVDTASVTRFFVKDGYSLFKPRYHDLSNIPSGLENPEGWRFVEFPIYNVLHGFLYQGVNLIKPGTLSLDTAGRYINIIFWLGAGVFLYLLVKKQVGEKAAFWSIFFFFFLPYNIYYSRTILPEPLMLLFALSSTYLLLQKRFVLATILGALALLVKPYVLFIIFPSLLVILGEDYWLKRDKKLLIKGFGFLLGIFLPFLGWRVWMKQFPEGIPGSGWLFNQGEIRFRPAWWRWLFGERIGRLILGHWGTALLAVGLIRKVKKDTLIFLAWLFGAFSYLVIFASGNVRHDYYQILLSPVIAVFMGLGVDFVFNLPSKLTINKLVLKPIVFGIIGLSLAFSWFFVKDYYSINRPEIVIAGDKANEILPPEAKVIAPYAGDTAFLYQTNRSGWPLITKSLRETILEGATHYVAVDYNYITQGLIEYCEVMFEDPEKRFIIVDLGVCDPEKITF